MHKFKVYGFIGLRTVYTSVTNTQLKYRKFLSPRKLPCVLLQLISPTQYQATTDLSVSA